MKRPSTASAGLNFLSQGYTIELSQMAVGPFLRYFERNKPGFELAVAYESEMAIIKPVKTTTETLSVKTGLKASLQRAGFNLGNSFFTPGVSPVN
ncbi:MAG: hypothetical protein ACO1OF_04860 [Adhaeribacter sp.]